MQYTSAKRVIIWILIVYFTVGVLTEIFGESDLYPVFSWSFFSIIQSEVHTYRVEIKEIGGVAYNPPLTFSDTAFLFEEVKQSPTDYDGYVIAMGKAFQENDPSRAAFHRRKLENIFPEGSYEYDLVLVTYDSIEYWHEKTYDVVKVLHTFAGTK